MEVKSINKYIYILTLNTNLYIKNQAWATQGSNITESRKSSKIKDDRQEFQCMCGINVC